MIYVFLAPGFEEIEALAVVDVLRRANYQVTTVAVGTPTLQVQGAHGITVTADRMEQEIAGEKPEAMVLPGGMPGTLNLERSDVVQAVLFDCIQEEIFTAAICAAPSILGHEGYLKGKRATCYPGFEEALEGATTESTLVVRDGAIITGKGPGAAIPFALEIVKAISGETLANQIGMEMQWLQA